MSKNASIVLGFSSGSRLLRAQKWTPELLVEACNRASSCIMYLWGCPFGPKIKVKGCSHVTVEDWASFLSEEDGDGDSAS